jgi:trimeric autotransporter adhesin
VQGHSSSQIGVYGQSNASFSAGMYGVSPYIGVQGVASGSDAGRQALRGENGGSSSGYAGFFNGNVWVYGTLIKNAGAFRIDHPLDPANKYLNHSFVESPDMMNVYNGNATTDGRGYATVELPDYFEVLNRDFRYQLTVIGTFAQAIIAEKVRGNQFVIQTDQPGIEVSWQVTGIRQDAWANENRIVVEEEKPQEQRGRYLHPTAFGLLREQGVDYDAEEEARMTEEQTRMEEERERRDAERRQMEEERARIESSVRDEPPH